MPVFFIVINTHSVEKAKYLSKYYFCSLRFQVLSILTGVLGVAVNRVQYWLMKYKV